MGGRPKSPYRANSDRGRQFGIITTTKDKARLAHLARWYCLSADHLARTELDDPRLWNPYLTGLPEGERPEFYAKRVRAIKERLGKLVRVEENPGNHTGPLVGSALVGDGKTAWYSTRYGISAASLPWRFRSGINPQFAAHAWMAADVGMQVESLAHQGLLPHPLRVLSERELATGIDKNGLEIGTNLDSRYINSSGQSVNKKPDVAVLSSDERTFLAIEVERDQNRPIATYADKLRAYDDNGAVRGVWYVCASGVTADRVATAAEKVFGSRSYPLRIVVARERDGWSGIEGLEQKANMMNDLRGLL